MGQKINPTGFRMGYFLPWRSRWFVEDRLYKDLLLEDIKIRKALTGHGAQPERFGLESTFQVLPNDATAAVSQ